jgi:cytochrome c biogenesis protein CcmG/thiol:disulfide interchange protein DsbE
MANKMETNSEMNVARWVDDCVASLNTDREWQPDTAKALARLRSKRSVRIGRGRRLTWIAVGAAAICIGFMALPVSGVLAHRCLECSVAILQSLSASRSVQTTVKPVDARKIAPDFDLRDASGKSVKLSHFRDKVVLLNFWATWCGGCKVEIPEFIEFQRKYKDSGFEVIGVSTDKDGWKVVKPFAEEKKINYTVVLGDDEICKFYAVEAMPVTLLIDREGRIAASHEGVLNKEAGEDEIEMLIQENSKNPAD